MHPWRQYALIQVIRSAMYKPIIVIWETYLQVRLSHNQTETIIRWL